MFVELLKENMGQKAGFRFDTDEVVAKALIEKGIAKGIQDDPLAPVIAKSMESMLNTITKSLNDTIDTTLKEFAQAQTKSRKNGVHEIFGEGQKGDPKKTFGAFLLAVRNKDVKALEEMGSRFCEWEQNVEKKTAMSTQTGANGGYLVPTEFHAKLMALVTEKSVVRSKATIIPMSGRSCQVPALDVTTAPSAGDTAMLGGLVARWTEEATAFNETEPNLKQIELVNYELSGYSKIANTLLADNAIGLESFLFQLFSRGISWYEDYAFLRGNGAGKPLGVLNWTGLLSVARSAASAFTLSDVANMYARLLPGFTASTCGFVIHPTVIAKLLQMAGGDNMIFIKNDVTSGPKMSILGLDVEVSEKVPALNTLGDVLLADWQHYLIGDRQQVEIAFSEHAAFLTNQTVWRFVSRVGGQPWMRDKVTLADASSTLSPFIGLAAG